jgi:hypothetical protein
MPTPTLPLRASLEAKLKLRASEMDYRHPTMLPWVREFNQCAGTCVRVLAIYVF